MQYLVFWTLLLLSIPWVFKLLGEVFLPYVNWVLTL